MYHCAGSDMSIPSQLAAQPAKMQGFRKTEGIHRKGLADDRPAANTVLVGTLYHSTDLGVTEISNGEDWETYFSAGLSSSVFFYRLTTSGGTGINDPGAGKYKYTTTNQHLTTTMVFDWLTDDGFDAHVLFQLFGPTTRFLIQDKALAVAFQLWEITSPATNLADFFTVPVSFVSGSGGNFSNNQRVAVIILPPSASGVI